MEKKIGYSILGTTFIALFAQLSIEVPVGESNIPITGQTFAVLLVGFVLGKKWGTISVVVYLLLGGFGLPIFADGKSGFEVFSQGSGGFLYGFLFAAFFIGYLREIGYDQTLAKCLIATALGTMVIIIFGVLHLSYLYGFEKALEYGFYPFWKGAVAKIVLGGIVNYYGLKIEN